MSRRLGFGALVTALVTLLALSYFNYRDWKQYRTSFTQTTEARRVLALNETVVDRMRDAETGQRGFLLTGRPEYLEPYNTAVERVSNEIGELTSSATGSREQHARFVQLQALVGVKLSELRNTIELRRSQGLSAALSVVQTDQGKQTMDRIRLLSQEIEEGENARWRAAWNDLQSEAGQVRILTLVGSVLLVVLVSSGGVALRRSADQMQQLVAQLKEAKTSAERNRDLLQATLYSIGEGVITTDREGAVQIMNGVAERLTGYSEWEVRGRNIETAFHIVNERSGASVENPVRRVLREGQIVGLANHTVLISKAGADTPIDDSGAPIKEATGGVSGVVLVFRDVSERKRAEENARRLASIVEHSDDAIIGKTLDGIVTTWNRAAERLFGYTALEMIGSSISRLIPQDRADDMTNILHRIGNGESIEHYETERVTKDGRRITVSLMISAIRDEDGRVIGASKIARDITREKQLEQRLRQAQTMEVIGQLAGGIAHDFNNLLTAINGYSSLGLMLPDVQDPLRHYLRQVEAAGKRATALTQQLLAFSRKQVLIPRVLSVNSIIAAMEPLLRRVIHESIEFRTVLDPAASPIEADPHQVEQVLMNLVVNARDAMPAGGKITIEVSNTVLDEAYARQRVDVNPGRYVMLVVSDTGTGMDPATQARAFEPFFTTKPVGKGTGLGLSTVYGIVKQSGGHVAVYSEIGVGTTFKVYFPATTEPLTEEASIPEVKSLRGTETILIVEDDASLREYAATVLKDLGYQVYQAADGDEAVATGQAQRDRIDLLITDVVMPKMGGRDLAEVLAPLAPRMRVLYVSGYTEDAIVQHGVLEPGLAFLAKPFGPEQLGAKVREVLATPARPRSILLVDDDAAVRDLLGIGLRQAGYDVSLASDGTEALSICRRKPIDLLITDLVMPEREGFEIIRYFREKLPHVPIIVISGAFSGKLLRAAQQLGAREALQKPVDLAKMVQTVRGIIG